MLAQTREQAADILQIVIVILGGAIVISVVWESLLGKKRKKK